eukprot:SAG31_NODE_3794_length_3876_cov_2.497485_3_plen_77_part_00
MCDHTGRDFLQMSERALHLQLHTLWMAAIQRCSRLQPLFFQVLTKVVHNRLRLACAAIWRNIGPAEADTGAPESLG